MNATSGVQMDKLARSILAEATGWPREHFWVRQYAFPSRLSRYSYAPPSSAGLFFCSRDRAMIMAASGLDKPAMRALALY